MSVSLQGLRGQNIPREREGGEAIEIEIDTNKEILPSCTLDGCFLQIQDQTTSAD
jgi:hypothetical protein